jgi:hypothetical protein
MYFMTDQIFVEVTRSNENQVARVRECSFFIVSKPAWNELCFLSIHVSVDPGTRVGLREVTVGHM